jgi:Ala-tRNA(Pro) deacylase
MSATVTTEKLDVRGPHAGLLDWLAANGVEYELHKHPATVTALETARIERVDPRRFAKTLAVELANGDRAIVVLDATARLDLVKAARTLDTTSVRLVTEGELTELAPDIEVGALPPVGQLFGLRVLADFGIHDDPTISFPAGSHRFAVMVDRAAWERAAHVVYADLAAAIDRGPIWAR